MMSKNSSNIAILNIYGIGYGCIIRVVMKSEAIKVIQKFDLTEKSGTL